MAQALVLTVALLCACIILIGLFLPTPRRIHGPSSARSQEQNNLKQMGIAMHYFASAYDGAFPHAAAFRSPEGKPLLSWRVALLPYIEQQALYQQFKLNEPWDSEHNIKLLPMMPKTYLQPGDPLDGKGLTRYQVLVGPGTVFEESAGKQGKAGEVRLGSNLNTAFTRKGTSDTILIATAEQGVPWTKPEDLAYDPKEPLPVFSKRFPGAFNITLADGTVRMIPHTISEQTLRNAITINHSNPLGPDW